MFCEIKIIINAELIKYLLSGIYDYFVFIKNSIYLGLLFLIKTYSVYKHAYLLAADGSRGFCVTTPIFSRYKLSV